MFAPSLYSQDPLTYAVKAILSAGHCPGCGGNQVVAANATHWRCRSCGMTWRKR